MKDRDRSNGIANALVSCTFCHGTGTRIVRHGREVNCGCAFRAIFRACYGRYKACAAVQGSPGLTGKIQHYCRQSGRPHAGYGFKNTEFMADFYLIAKRVLTDPLEWGVFALHFLARADWKICCQQLRIDRGTFFHTVYIVEQKLGRMYGELEPYSLWPLDEYFTPPALGDKAPTSTPAIQAVPERKVWKVYTMAAA